MTEASTQPGQPMEPPAPPRPRRRPGGPALAWLALLALLAVPIALGPSAGGTVAQLANPSTSAVDAVEATFAALPAGGLVLVAMDADLGTYPEIRAATRAVLADLLGRGASLGVVSVSVEGRAIAVAELDRLRQASVPPGRMLDLGFLAGAESGMVRLVDGALRPGMTTSMAALIAQRGGGIGAFDLIVLIGGSDIGPRTWVEQVGTRLPNLPMVAVAPTFAQPELAPYLRTGQLDGMLATVRDDAAYVQRVGESAGDDAPPNPLAMLVGLVVALAILLRQLAGAVPLLRGAVPALQEAQE